jgi:hypothetical protein
MAQNLVKQPATRQQNLYEQLFLLEHRTDLAPRLKTGDNLFKAGIRDASYLHPLLQSPQYYVCGSFRLLCLNTKSAVGSSFPGFHESRFSIPFK